MTRTDALAEARRRWGPNIRLLRTRNYSTVGFSAAAAFAKPPVYCVYADGKMKASGLSWKAAFADADRRAQ